MKRLKHKELEERQNLVEEQLALVLKVLHSHQGLLESLVSRPKLINPNAL